MADMKKLTVGAELDATGMKKGANEVKKELRGIGAEARKMGSDVGGSTKTAGSGFGPLVKQIAVAGAALGAVAVAVKSSLAAYSKQVQSVNALNVALANQNKATSAALGSLQAYATAMQKVTMFSDNQIMSVQTLLAQYGATEDQITRATESVLDMAASGENLRTSAVNVGKAISGQTTSLKSYGIELDKDKDKGARFDDMLKGLQERFGGQARAAAEGYAGQLAQLGHAFDGVKEAAGKMLGFLGGAGSAGFGLIKGALEGLTTFIKVDVIITIGELQATFSRFLAFVADMSAKVMGVLAKLPGGLGKDAAKAKALYEGMADDLRKFAGEQEIAAFKVAHGNDVAAASNKKLAKTTDELTDAEKKRLKALQALVDKISGAKAQKEMNLLAEAVAKVGLKGIKNFETLRDDINKLVEAGAKAPPMLEAIARAGDYAAESFKAIDTAAIDLGDSVGEVAAEAFNVMDAFKGVAGMDVFEDIARSAREVNIPLKEIPNILKTAGASAKQVKAIMGTLKGEAFDWSKSLETVSRQFQNIGSMAGGVLGDILQGFANIATQIAGINSTLDQFGKGMGAIAGLKNIGASFGQGFSGILQGLTGALPIIGGVMSIGKTIFGGIKSLFGGKSKEEKAAEEARKKAWEDLSGTLEDQYGTLGQLRDQASKYGVDLSNAMDTKDAEEMNKQLKELEKRQQGLKNAASGISKVIENIKPTTEAGALAQAGLFSTVFWATVQREGLVAASDALRGAFDTLMEDASASMQAFLGPIATQMNLAANEAFASAAEGAAGLAEAIKGMTDAGILSVQDMTNAGQVAMDAYNQALAAAHTEGLVGAQAQEAAIRAVGPAVAQIKAAYEAAGIPIDANTQALIDQAAASGMAFATDPMTRAANAMEQVALALGQAFGIAINLGDAFGGVAGQANRAAQAASRIPASVPTIPGGGGGQPQPPTIRAQKGLAPSVLGQDTIIRAHKGEGVMVVPRKQMSHTGFASAQQGIGHIPGPRKPSKGLVGSSYGPGIVNRPTIVVNDNAAIKTPEGVREFNKQTVEGIYKALDQNAQGLATRVKYQQRTRCRSRI